MENQKKRLKSKGFTLMEMVVVIAIIAILATIAAPQALRAINRSRASSDIASAKTIATAIMQAQAEGYTPTNSDWIEVKEGLFNGDTILKKYEIKPIPKVKANSSYSYFFKIDGSELLVGVGDESGSAPSTILYPEVKAVGTGGIDKIYEDFQTTEPSNP